MSLYLDIFHFVIVSAEKKNVLGCKSWLKWFKRRALILLFWYFSFNNAYCNLHTFSRECKWECVNFTSFSRRGRINLEWITRFLCRRETRLSKWMIRGRLMGWKNYPFLWSGFLKLHHQRSDKSDVSVAFHVGFCALGKEENLDFPLKFQRTTKENNRKLRKVAYEV